MVWIDAAGKTAAHLLTTVAGGGAVRAQVAAVSNAAVQTEWEGPLTVTPAPAPAPAPYAAVSDWAVLLFQTASGAGAKLYVPAPKASIFMADQETVDPAQVAALTAQVIADCVTASGIALVSFLGGTRNAQK